VALVQTIYTTYGNDGIHFGVGTAMAAPAASATLVVAAGAAATAAPTAAGIAMTAAPVAAGAMAMATAPTAACAAQQRQQGTSSREGEQGAYTHQEKPNPRI
jgi:hypothetical protein